MKKTFFDLRLYADGVKQLKIMGILFALLTTVVAIVNPIMNQLDYLSYYSTLPDYAPTPDTMDYWGMNPLIILLFCVYAPIMTLYLFTFINKRESSDFYHAIPATRQCLFFSFFAAVMTWVLIITAVPTLICTTVYALLPHLYLINYTSILFTCFNCIAGALFIAGAVAIAMSVTGTVFTNLLVALILIFFPRMLLELIVASIQSTFPLVNGLDFAPIFASSYNVPVGFIFSIFMGDNMNTPLTQWQSGVYTLVVGLIYMVLACVLFVRRRSESAGHSAPSRLLQGFYRFLIGLVITCVATFGLFTLCIEGNSLDLPDLGTIVLLWLAAVGVALVFEVLCTRTFRGLAKKALHTTGLLIVANIVLFAGMYGLGKAMFLYRPDAEDITSVRILSDSDGYYYSGNRPEYFTAATSQVELTDPEIKKIVSRQLNYTLDVLEISLDRYHKEGASAQSTVVAIKSGFVTHYRRIYLYSKDLEILSERLYEVEEYRNAYTHLPESVSNIYCGGANKYMGYYRSDDPNELYSLLKSEIAKLDFEVWYRLMNGGLYNGREALCLLEMKLVEDGQWYTMNVPLYPELMPETTETVINVSNANCNAAEGLDALVKDADRLATLELQYYDGNGESSGLSYIDLSKAPELRAKVAEWLKTLDTADATTNIQIDKPFVYLVGYVEYEENNYNGETYTYFDTNYCFAQEPSGDIPAWLAEYLKDAQSSVFDDLLDEKWQDTTTPTTITG